MLVNVMKIPRQILEELIQHARREYPNECCGILGGQGDEVRQLFPLTNIDRSPVKYLADPREQLGVFQKLEGGSEEMVGIYHSHPNAPCYPSQIDVGLAAYPEAVYIIISLIDRENPQVRGFRIVEGTISEEELEII